MRPVDDALARAGLQVEVTDAAVRRLEAFIQLRADWAKTHNLAGPRALASPWQIDVVDGLAVFTVMAPSLPLVDVGAGGGIPGIIVAAMAPNQTVILVEPRAKRAAFLRTAVHALSLSKVRVLRSRWPLDHDLGPVQVVSRAVVSPESWPGLALQGGPNVEGVLRMLAADRPSVSHGDIELRRGVDYGAVIDGGRRVEYWGRRNGAD